MIRLEHHDLPPAPFLMQIMDETTKLYCYLWEKKDKCNRIKMTWTDVSHKYHKHAFRSCLRRLNSVALLDYRESEDGVSIELVGWNDISE